MNCPYRTSITTKEQTQKTTLGYRTFRCFACKHLFNERTGTPFNFLEYPPMWFFWLSCGSCGKS